jgi:hypothetical protein
MSEDYRHALAQIIAETHKSYPGLPEDKFFERFAAEQVLKSHRLEVDSDELRAGSHGGGNDGGVDTLFLFVNRRLVREDTDIAQFTDDRLSIELIVVQATRSAGFSESGVTKFGDFARYCLRLTAKHDEVRSSYRASLLTMVDKFRKVYGDNLHKRPTLLLRFYYVSQADKVDTKVETRRKQFLSELETYFANVDSDMVFVGAETLLKWFNRQIETTIPLPMKSSAFSRVPGTAYVGLVRLTDFYKFITDDAGALREHLFESNVRHFQGPTKVNKEIRETLVEKEPTTDFWWLNNGVTIIASEFSGDRELLSVTDPLIVNGLQTSFVVHDYFSSSGSQTQGDDERLIMVRLIKASDAALTDAIIKATNSQTYIPPAWLHATEDIHRNIETVFRGKDLYYDRRKGYHRRRGIPASKIIPLPYLAQAIVAIVLKRPDEARARPTAFVTTHYRKIFQKDGGIDIYVKCAQVMKRVEQFLDGTAVDQSDHNNLRFYLAMVAVSFALENAVPRRDAIARLDLSTLTDVLMWKAMFLVEKAYEHGNKTDVAAKGPDMLKEVSAELQAIFPKRLR